MKFYSEITKSEIVEDQRLVWGYASTEALDSQGEIVSREAIEDALQEYMKFANVRLMHQPIIAGICKEARMTEKGLEICVKVLDDKIWEMVKEGAIKGFSIGGRVIKRAADDAKKILKMLLTEISLVDRPANPEALISLYKADNLEGEQEGVQEVNTQEQEIATPVVEKANQSAIWDAARAMEALTMVSGLLSNEEWEKEQAPDQIAALNAAIESLKSFISSELSEPEEEKPTDATSDMVAMSDKPADIEKAGKEFSSKNAAMIQELHDKCMKMGAKCAHPTMTEIQLSDLKSDIQKSEKAAFDDVLKGELAKAQETHTEALETLKKAHSEELSKANGLVKEQSEKMEKMVSRIKELEAMPQPAKGSLKAVSKSQDGREIEKQAGNTSNFLDEIKKIHQTGGRPIRGF